MAEIIREGDQRHEALLEQFSRGQQLIVWRGKVWRAVTDGEGGVYFVAEYAHTFNESYDGGSLAMQARDVLK